MLPYAPPRSLLERWFPDGNVRCAGRLDGGFLNDVFRIEDDGGRRWALRVLASRVTLDSLLWEHELLERLAPRVPEVVAPLPAPDGNTWLEYEGHLTTLQPFIDGDPPVRFRREHRLASAHTLARIHQASVAYPHPIARPGWPPWRQLDWRQNGAWSWPSARRSLPGTQEAPEGVDPGWIAEQIDGALELIPVALHELGRHRLAEIPIHGDFWAGNLRADDDHIVGVFDWDEARLDWRACEVADATWSFARYPRNDDFDRDVAREFVAAYRDAGGTLTAEEESVLVLLMRARRLWEALWLVGEWQRGGEIDWYYLHANARALARLSGEEAL